MKDILNRELYTDFDQWLRARNLRIIDTRFGQRNPHDLIQIAMAWDAHLLEKAKAMIEKRLKEQGIDVP